jgi:phage shock protein PspC (stress-responsive transcriptional regulator)
MICIESAAHDLHRGTIMTASDTTQPSSHHHPIESGTLRRPREQRILGGVAAAIAGWLGVDVTVVRIGLVVLALLGGAAVPLYAAGWALIPEEGAERSIAQRMAAALRRH